MSPNTIHALRILERKPRITPRQFAILYFGDGPKGALLEDDTPLGGTAVRGARGWLAAGSYLGRLAKMGLLVVVSNKPKVYAISAAGREALRAAEEERA